MAGVHRQYDFLNLPEGQWLRIIQNRSPKDDISPQLELFPQKEGPNFENYKTNAYLQAIKQQNYSNPDFIGQQYKIIKTIMRYAWVVRYIIPTIYFNFHYLPFKQAIYLPIWLRKPKLLNLKGEISIPGG